MAQDLPFSISNILRSDFPNPSRISPTPRMLYIEHLREKELFKKSLQTRQCVRGLHRGDVFDRGSLFAAKAQKEGVFLCSGCNRQREVAENYSLEPREEHNKEREITAEGTKDDNKTTGQNSAVKTKKRRTHFSQRQVAYLEDVFSRQKYLTRDERALLAGALYLTELQIRNWFQNRRYQLKQQIKAGPKRSK